MVTARSKLTRVYSLFFGCIFCITSQMASAETSVKLMTYTDHPPYLYTENGEITGLYLDIVAITLESLNQPFTVEALPFKRALVQTEAGEGLIVGILKTDQRETIFDFSESFYQERIVVFANRPKDVPMTTVQELAGQRVGTLFGWSYGAEFDRERSSNLFSAQDGELKSNFYMLAKNRLDAVIHTELSSGFIIKQLDLKQKIYVVSEPLALGDIYIASKKGTRTDLLKRFNEKLKDPNHREKIKLLIERYTP